MIWLLLGIAAAAPPDIGDPLRTGASRAGDAAVVVGIEDYAFLPDVPYAKRDAEAMAVTLMHTVGIPADRIERLDGGNREQILRAVDAVSDAERVWVYFAGHGAASPDGALMLVGDDAKRDPAVFSERSLLVDELVDRLPDGAVVILDTCYAGSGRDGTELVPGTRFAVPTYATTRSSAQVWTAAGPSEISGPYEPARHGLFTYFAVGALRGWADGELSGQRDGEVSAAEAQAFVSRALSTLGTRSQTPGRTGPDGAVLVSADGLEEGPDMSSLPDTDGVIRAAPEAVATLADPARPSIVYQADVPFVPPVSYVGWGRYEDANGATVPATDLTSLIARYPAGSRAARAVQTSDALRYQVVPAAIIGGVLVGVGLTNDDDGGRPSGFAQGMAYTGFGIAGTGALLATVGGIWHPVARKRLAESYNDTVDAPGR